MRYQSLVRGSLRDKHELDPHSLNRKAGVSSSGVGRQREVIENQPQPDACAGLTVISPGAVQWQASKSSLRLTTLSSDGRFDCKEQVTLVACVDLLDQDR